MNDCLKEVREESRMTHIFHVWIRTGKLCHQLKQRTQVRRSFWVVGVMEEDGGIDLIREFLQQAVKHLTVKLG